jgi:hypothetical protein
MDAHQNCLRVIEQLAYERYFALIESELKDQREKGCLPAAISEDQRPNSTVEIVGQSYQ